MAVRLIVTVGLALALAVAAVDAGPLLEVSTSDIDFGRVPVHFDVSYVMWVYSTGDSTLTIKRFESDCPCIKSDFKGPLNLEPGDSVAITVRFNSHRFVEQVNRTPTIYANDVMETHRVRVSAYIALEPEQDTPLAVKPFALDISPIGTNARESAPIVLFNQSNQPLHPTLVYAPDEVKAVELPPEIAPGATSKAMVVLEPWAVDTTFLRSFTIQVDDQKKTRYTIPLRREVAKQ